MWATEAKATQYALLLCVRLCASYHVLPFCLLLYERVSKRRLWVASLAIRILCETIKTYQSTHFCLTVLYPSQPARRPLKRHRSPQQQNSRLRRKQQGSLQRTQRDLG